MEFGLSEEQQILQDSITRFCRQHISPKLVHDVSNSDPDDLEMPARLWQELVRQGIAGVLVPEEQGGAGLTLFEAFLVAEVFGYSAAPLPYLNCAVLAPLALVHSAKDDWQQRLSQLAAGKLVVAVGLGGMNAVRQPDTGIRVIGSRASGRSLFVLDAWQPHALLLAAADNQLVWIDADAPGVTRRHMRTIDRTRRFSEVILKNVPVQVLASGATGAHILRELLAVARVILAADILGAAQSMLDRAVAHSLVRKQFDRLIGSFQAVKHMCADMAAQLEPCRSLVWYAAHVHQVKPDEFELMACHAKAHLADVGQMIAKTSIEVHGGAGFTDQLGLHLWFKRIGLDRQLLGGAEQVREAAARLQGYC